MLAGFDTVSIGEPSARLADPSSGPATTAQEWGVSVINSGEFPVIVTMITLAIVGTVIFWLSRRGLAEARKTNAGR